MRVTLFVQGPVAVQIDAEDEADAARQFHAARRGTPLPTCAALHVASTARLLAAVGDDPPPRAPRPQKTAR